MESAANIGGRRQGEAILAQQQELDEALNRIDRELSAIDAYEAAKVGKPAPRPRAGRQGSGARGRRGSKREAIVRALNESVGGLTRGELLEQMGLKGDKSGEMSVSNALTALIKGGQVRRGANRKYLTG